MRPAARRHAPVLGLLIALGCGLGCAAAPDAPPPMPPAQLYEVPPDFSGAWRGVVENVQGTLEIDALGAGAYRGVYTGSQRDVRFVLKLDQSMRTEGDEVLGTNRLTFTWQDGRGGRGSGWLMIDRRNSALTGAFGEGGGHTGGTWTFSRA